MPLWLVPTVYAAASIVAGFVLPRIENAYFAAYTHGMSAASAVAALSAIASGMMALTAIVFSIVFVMVTFSAIAYSPRLVLWFSRDSTLYHSLGIFVATFVYTLQTIAWTDRGGSAKVPLFSVIIVAALLILSIILFCRLVRRVGDLQITSVLYLIGDNGRKVIDAMFRRLDRRPDLDREALKKFADGAQLGPATQVVTHAGPPRAIAKFDIAALLKQAHAAGAVIVMAYAVGDTVVDGSVLLRVYGAKTQLRALPLRRAIHLARERTFEQDPKYPIRLLVDVAIKALSPAINDPTTAVQAIDQIEDLLGRLARSDLDIGCARDADHVVRLVFPMPTWDDYLALAFDEIRQYGAGSIQVMRRLRAALAGLAGLPMDEDRVEVVRHYLRHLDQAIERSPLDDEDRAAARQEDPQGLGLTRRRIGARA